MNNNMNNNNCLIMGQKKKVKKTRNRQPVAPKFALPERGYRCINWLPIGKREIKKRVQDLGGHRLQVVELAINHTMKHLFEYFNLSINNQQQQSFKLEYDLILNKLISEWDDKLLNDWNGPKLKSTTWETKLWEGKNGYWKLCKNWADQNKYQVSHIFWCNVYTQIMVFIKSIANTQYPSSSDSLYVPFLNCLKYACLYAIFAAKIGFPKTRLLPLLVNTVIAKNGELKRYLQQEYDSELDIKKWKQQEAEKYEEINNAATKDNKVCAAVKERCIQYSANKMQMVFNEFYQSMSINSMIPSTILDVNKYNVSIEFDATGNISKKKRIQTSKSKPKKTKTTKNKNSNKRQTKTSSSLMDQDMNDRRDRIPPNLSLMDDHDTKSNESSSASNPSISTYRTYCPYEYEPQPSAPTVPPVSLPVPVPTNNNNHLVNPLYGATHGQSRRVMDNRADPTMSLHRRQSFPNMSPMPSHNMYRSNIISRPSNLRRNRSDISNLSVDGHHNRLNGINLNQFEPQRMNINTNRRMNTAQAQIHLHEIQQENHELRRHIAECQAMLRDIASAGTMGINHININGPITNNIDYQMSIMGNTSSMTNTNDYNMMSRDVHNFRNYSMNNNQPRLQQQSTPSQPPWIPSSQSLQSSQSTQSISSSQSMPSSESSSTISHSSVGVLGDIQNMNIANPNGPNIVSPSSTISNRSNYTDQIPNYGHMNNNNIDSGQQPEAPNTMFTISDANSTANVCYSRANSQAPPPLVNIFPDNDSLSGFSPRYLDMNRSTMNNADSYRDGEYF